MTLPVNCYLPLITARLRRSDSATDQPDDRDHRGDSSKAA